MSVSFKKNRVPLKWVLPHTHPGCPFCVVKGNHKEAVAMLGPIPVVRNTHGSAISYMWAVKREFHDPP